MDLSYSVLIVICLVLVFLFLLCGVIESLTDVSFRLVVTGKKKSVRL